MISNSTATPNVCVWVEDRVIAWVESIKTVNEKQKNRWNHWTEEDGAERASWEEWWRERSSSERMTTTKTLLSRATTSLPTSSSELPLLHTRFRPMQILSSIFYVNFSSILLPNVNALILRFTSLILLSLFCWSIFLPKEERRKRKSCVVVIELSVCGNVVNLNHDSLMKSAQDRLLDIYSIM